MSGEWSESICELYCGDEVSVLLEEIRELEEGDCLGSGVADYSGVGVKRGLSTAGINQLQQNNAPPTLRPDVQDFEIAGSATGDTPTVHSWDSHQHYKARLPPSSPDHSIFSGVVLYCDDNHLTTSQGILRILLVISSVACLACLCSSGTVSVGLFMLPLVTRLRLMMFSTVFSLLVTLLFLFLDVSHVVYLFPFNWGKFNAVVYLILSLLYLLSSSLLIHLLNAYAETYHWVPKWTSQQLLVTGILGYVCALEAFILCVVSKCDGGQYSPVEEEPSSMSLQERSARVGGCSGISRIPSDLCNPGDSPTPTTLPSGHTPGPSAPLLFDQPSSSKHQHYLK